VLCSAKKKSNYSLQVHPQVHPQRPLIANHININSLPINDGTQYRYRYWF